MDNESQTLIYIICGFMGGAVGIIELISRYKDDPLSALFCPAAAVYTLVNVGASIGALFLLRIFAADSLGEPGTLENTVKQVLVSGLGAMAFLRTSIFNVSIGQDKVAVGPAALLEVLLGAADRAVDRKQAITRATKIIKDIKIQNVSFPKAKIALPAYCFTLMQNVSPKEQNVVEKHVKSLENNPHMTNPQKAQVMGLLLMNVVGPIALKEAVNGLGGEILTTEEEKDKEKEQEAKQRARRENIKKNAQKYKAQQGTANTDNS